jgi:glutamyl-tRNA reductase
MKRDLFSPLTIAGLSHHKGSVSDLEAFRFPDEEEFLKGAHNHIAGVMLLQTCNRIEVYAETDAESLSHFMQTTGRTDFQIWEDTEALLHLLELAAGIDSMIIGEDQILGQIKKMLLTAETLGTASPLLSLCMKKAIHVGTDVRTKTKINKGAVSVGSAAVQLAEDQIGSLKGRHILVVGSGEMGLLVAQALAAKDLSAIYVANRTYGRACILAQKIKGTAVRMDDLYRYIALSDVVICCTAAPHPVIKYQDLTEAMRGRTWPLDSGIKPLILIDIAQPRDVESDVTLIEGVRLFTIDDLKEVNERTADNRRGEAEHAKRFIKEELGRFIRQYNQKAADQTLATLYSWGDSIRIRERDRALERLQNCDDRTKQVVEDLSRALVKKFLADVTYHVKISAEEGNLEYAKQLVHAITNGGDVCSHKDE